MPPLCKDVWPANANWPLTFHPQVFAFIHIWWSCIYIQCHQIQSIKSIPLDPTNITNSKWSANCGIRITEGGYWHVFIGFIFSRNICIFSRNISRFHFANGRQRIFLVCWNESIPHISRPSPPKYIVHPRAINIANKISLRATGGISCRPECLRLGTWAIKDTEYLLACFFVFRCFNLNCVDFFAANCTTYQIIGSLL